MTSSFGSLLAYLLALMVQVMISCRRAPFFCSLWVETALKPHFPARGLLTGRDRMGVTQIHVAKLLSCCLPVHRYLYVMALWDVQTSAWDTAETTKHIF